MNRININIIIDTYKRQNLFVDATTSLAELRAIIANYSTASNIYYCYDGDWTCLDFDNEWNQVVQLYFLHDRSIRLTNGKMLLKVDEEKEKMLLRREKKLCKISIPKIASIPARQLPPVTFSVISNDTNHEQAVHHEKLAYDALFEQILGKFGKERRTH